MATSVFSSTNSGEGLLLGLFGRDMPHPGWEQGSGMLVDSESGGESSVLIEPGDSGETAERGDTGGKGERDMRELRPCAVGGKPAPTEL
jgi:hypothetical protein